MNNQQYEYVSVDQAYHEEFTDKLNEYAKQGYELDRMTVFETRNEFTHIIGILRRPVKFAEELTDQPIERFNSAIELIERHWMVSEADHKQWLIDQIARTLLGPNLYQGWRPVGWDQGVAP